MLRIGASIPAVYLSGRRRKAWLRLKQVDVLCSQRADARTRKNDSRQIERIGGSDAKRPVRRPPADGAEQVHGFRPPELLAEKTGNETPAANFSAGLHAAQGDEQFAPGRSKRFACEKIAEHNAPAKQKLAAEGRRALLPRR